MRFKLTYTKHGEFRHSLVTADNMTAALHAAELSGWAVKGWEFIGLERIND